MKNLNDQISGSIKGMRAHLMGTILLILAKSQNFYRLSFKWRCNQKWNVVLNPNPYSIWEPTYAFSCLLENTFYRSFTEITCEKFLIISWTTNPSQFRNYVWYQHLGCPRSKIIGNWLKAINYFISGWYPFITFWLECVATTPFNVWF